MARLAVDGVLVDQREHQRRRRTEHAVETPTDFRAEAGFDVVRRNPHAGIDQPDVAPGATMPGGMRLHHADRQPLFEQMQRRRQAGEPGTDDAHVGLVFPPQRRRLRPFGGQVFPQTFLAKRHPAILLNEASACRLG
ncbi:hypothetical protein D3C80_1506830 [compost metagenome]